MCDKCLQRQAKAPVDHSYLSLVELQEEGYTDVRFVARDRACPVCRRVHNLKVKIEKLISETQYEASIYTLSHPGCFIYPHVKVYTSKGYRKIIDVQVGDLVLTHKGKFRKVLQKFASPSCGHKIEIVHLEVATGMFKGTLTITSEHPVLTERGWKDAGGLTKEDKVGMVGHSCPVCGEFVGLLADTCSHTCATKRQWKEDGKYRQIISKTASDRMNKLYKENPQARRSLTEKAHQVSKQLAQQGEHNFQSKENRELVRVLSHTSEIRKKSSLRMIGEKNPSKKPEVILKGKQTIKRLREEGKLLSWYKTNSKEKVDVVKKGMVANCRKTKYERFKNGYYRVNFTKPERVLYTEFESQQIPILKQYPILIEGRLLTYADTFIEPNVVVYVDGNYWHNYPDGTKRDRYVNQCLIENGYKVLRFWESDIYKDPKKCVGVVQELLTETQRIQMNHNGEYRVKFGDIVKLTKKKMKVKTRYNLAVEEDESYVVSGIAVHNCNCFLEVSGKGLRTVKFDYRGLR